MTRLPIRRLLQWGLILIVAAMPFHAFFSVWAGHLLGHQSLWQSWKDVLIALMAAGSLLILWQDPKLIQRFKNTVVLSIAGFIMFALLVTVIKAPGFGAAIFGLKIDIEFFVLFFIAWLVTDRALKLLLIKALLISTAAVIGFGLLQIFILPQDFLTHFGYGHDTIAPYLTVDPTFHTVRILSTDQCHRGALHRGR